VTVLETGAGDSGRFGRRSRHGSSVRSAHGHLHRGPGPGRRADRPGPPGNPGGGTAL